MHSLVIVWRVWESCALSCCFCGYSREQIRPRLAIDLSAARVFGKVLGDLQQQCGATILVSWLGGEPLSWEALPSLARFFHRECGLQLGVTTNGQPLQSQQVRASLLADYEQVTISIDGLAPLHDQVRGLPGLYDRLQAIVSDLREDDAGRLWRRVNTVLMRGNIGAFGRFCEEMADWGFHELTFNQLGGNDRPEFYPANRLLPEQVARFARELPTIRKRMADRGMIVRGSQRYLARISATTAGRQVAIDDCRPGTEFLFIDALGRISPCSYSSDCYGISISEIDSVEAFVDLPRRFAELRRRSRLAACDDCHATHVFDKFRSDAEIDAAVAK
jgi:MoaA/NifB/PqqE/SkfB family radical SAM enzyme